MDLSLKVAIKYILSKSRKRLRGVDKFKRHWIFYYMSSFLLTSPSVSETAVGLLKTSE